MGIVVIMLLVTIAATPPVALLVSMHAARWVSYGGTLLALGFGYTCMLLDMLSRRQR